MPCEIKLTITRAIARCTLLGSPFMIPIRAVAAPGDCAGAPIIQDTTEFCLLFHRYGYQNDLIVQQCVGKIFATTGKVKMQSKPCGGVAQVVRATVS